MSALEQLPTLHFPPGSPFDLRDERQGRLILDRVRRRFVRLTPEEWVRQHLVRTLVEHLGYPPGLIALEPTITTTAGPRRPDVVVFGRERQALLIAECKAPAVPLNQAVLDQVSRYNVIALAPVLVVTNGLQHHCWKVNRTAGTFDFLEDIPTYRDLT